MRSICSSFSKALTIVKAFQSCLIFYILVLHKVLLVPNQGSMDTKVQMVLEICLCFLLPFPGYTGVYCEVDVNACALPNVTCPPGTFCVDLPGDQLHMCHTQCPHYQQVGQKGSAATSPTQFKPLYCNSKCKLAYTGASQ